MNKRKFPVTNIGSVSLLMIFIVQLLSTGASTAWNHRQRRIPDLFFSDSCQQVTGTGSPDPDHLSGQFRYSRV